MKRVAHWTPKYTMDRMLLEIDYRRHPDDPWLTRTSIEALRTLLLSSDRGLEFGSGRSTSWLSARVSHLISVEHDQVWYNKVLAQLSERNITNVDYRFCTASAQNIEGYTYALKQIENDSLNFVLIDGLYREHCSSLALDKLNPNGLLILDNADRYLPTTTNTPNARRMRGAQITTEWKHIHTRLANWRRLWTTNGVTDTAIFIKPH